MAKRTTKKYTQKVAILLFSLFISAFLQAQQNTSLGLDTCYALAKTQYPLSKQKALIEKTKEYSIENASKGYLPQLNLSGQASYQSDVTEIPISIPNMSIPSISKDQYKLYAEINQPLTDLVIIKQQKELIKSNAAIEEQKLEVELYKLKERINQLFFGILLIDEQLNQAALLKKDLQSGIDKLKAAVANGIAIKSSVNVLSAELLKIDQRTIELNSSRKAYAEMLGLFINRTLDENTKLIQPETQDPKTSINRPELIMFESQKKSFDINNKLLTAKNMPRLNLFLQGGAGKPSPVNLFSQDFSSYYIGGLRLTWPITGFYTLKNERSMLQINESVIDLQKETFLFNTQLALNQQSREITKLNELISTDKNIIELRTNIKETANVQLENGSITANDYLREVIAEDQAKQNLLLHEVQLLMTQYTHQTTAGY